MVTTRRAAAQMGDAPTAAAASSDGSGDSKSRLRQALEFVVGIGGFMSAGPTLILMNNQVLKDTSFKYPIALSSVGVAFAGLTSRLLLYSGLIVFTKPELRTSWSFYLRSTLPISALSALTLALGNASYIYLSVTMCQMLKAVTPAIALALLVILRIETPSSE